MLNLQRYKSQNLAESIVEYLGRAIVTGEFQGERAFPTENELCARLRVSRAALREAVKMLTSKGLLDARARRGTQVLPQSRWNLLDSQVLEWLLRYRFSIALLCDLTNLRLAVEPRAAALAAHCATRSQQEAIIGATEKWQAAERGEEDLLDADIAFHVSVLQGSNNVFFEQFANLTTATLGLSAWRTLIYSDISRASAADHERLANYIVSGDATAASRTMYALIEGSLKILHTRGTRNVVAMIPA